MTTSDNTLTDLLARWEERWEHGEDSPAAELCAGRPELVEDPRFASVAARRDPTNKVAFEEIFRPWALARTKRECMEAGQAAKVYCGAIFTPAHDMTVASESAAKLKYLKNARTPR